MSSARRKTMTPRELVMAPREVAARALGRLSPGVSLSMVTRGQFSLLDLIFAVLEQTGPADVVLSTWTMGIRDAENARKLLEDGRMKSLRFLVDRSFPGRQPEYARRVEKLFGPDVFVLSRVHAKFAVIVGESGLAACIRSSMNLNANERWEQADVDCDAGLCAFYAGLVSELGGKVPAGLDVSEDAIQAGMDGWASRLREAPPPTSVAIAAARAVEAPPLPGDAAPGMDTASVRYWRSAMDGLRVTMGGAIEDRSWQAVAALQSRLNECHRELMAAEEQARLDAQEEERRRAEEMDAPAVFAAVLAAARDLPPDVREQLVAALVQAPQLRVVGE